MDLDATEDEIAYATLTDPVVVETMPEYIRASHQAARNWGSYPANGAERSVMSREDAESLVDEDDDYDHIVRDATVKDAKNYGVKVSS